MSRTQINMADVVTAADFTQPLTLTRHKGGEWVDGEFIEQNETISFMGVVSAANSKDINMTAEGARISEYKVLHTTTEIYTTNDTGTSDIVTWNGDRYKVMEVKDASDYGYYRAVMHRLSVVS